MYILSWASIQLRFLKDYKKNQEVQLIKTPTFYFVIQHFVAPGSRQQLKLIKPMKNKCLLQFMVSLMAILFFSGSISAAPGGDDEIISGAASDPDFSSLYFTVRISWDQDPVQYPLVKDGSDTHYKVENVPIPGNSGFNIENSEGKVIYGNPSGYITIDNYVCTLDYVEENEMYNDYWSWNTVNGKWDISIDFEEDKAVATFTKVGIVIVPSDMYLITSNRGVFPQKYDSHSAVYENIMVNEGSRVYLRAEVVFGWETEDHAPVTDQNPTTQLVVGGECEAVTSGMSGVYDIYVEYDEDFNVADITFKKKVVPEELRNYQGDLYIIGTLNDREKKEEYKLVNEGPGKYTWKGDVLKGYFRFAGAEETIPGTDISLNLGSLNGYEDIYPESWSTIVQDGKDFMILPANIEYHDVTLTLDLNEMRFMFDGERVRGLIPLEDFRLISDTGLYLMPEVEGDTLLFAGMEVENIGYMIYNGVGIFYGVPYDAPVEVDDENPEVTLYPGDEILGTYFYPTNLSGIYDIYVTLNNDQSEAYMKFVIDPASVDSVNSGEGYNVNAYDCGILISNVEVGTDVAVYTVDGKLVANNKSFGDAIRIDLEISGIYIVRIGESVIKVHL